LSRNIPVFKLFRYSGMYLNYFDDNQLGHTAGTMASIMEDLDLSITQVCLITILDRF